MLEHTLARVELLIPRQRILIVVSQHHREEVAQQLSHWPPENVIFQPANRDTAPGILLPLAHISHREPFATVAVFPSDHFIVQEERFMSYVQRAVIETERFPQQLTLLGMTPDQAEEGYGWIELAEREEGRATHAVQRFWEKPTSADTQMLFLRGAMWNTFVLVAKANTLWEMTRQAASDLYANFMSIRRALANPHATTIIESIYRTMRPVNFSAEMCERLTSRLQVLPVPEVGWSDWGSVERICASLEQLGKLHQVLARLRHRGEDVSRLLSLQKWQSLGLNLG